MWPNPQETADLVTFTEGILNGKLHFLCSDHSSVANPFAALEGMFSRAIFLRFKSFGLSFYWASLIQSF